VVVLLPEVLLPEVVLPDVAVFFDFLLPDPWV
jgi:hypothetical protein